MSKKREKTANSTRPQVAVPNVVLDLPLLSELHRLNDEAEKRFAFDGDTGFRRLGLILNKELEFGGYWCSPKNALTFARTGGDGDHYSLLIHDDRIDEKSAVVLTWPSEGDQQIVGENLYDFLCFGMHGGYFQINSVSSESPPPNAPRHWFCEHVDEQNRKLLTFLASELGLKPWGLDERHERFQRLQQELLPRVVVDTEPD